MEWYPAARAFWPAACLGTGLAAAETAASFNPGEWPINTTSNNAPYLYAGTERFERPDSGLSFFSNHKQPGKEFSYVPKLWIRSRLD